MNKLFLFLAILLFTIASSFAQSNFKDYKIGHVFHVELPEYMGKTSGLNTSACIQFKNTVKDVAGFIIEDSKADLTLADLNYSSLNEFYEDFIKDFLKDEEKRTISTPIIKKIGSTNFIECDASYADKESKIEIYYFIGMVETPAYFYKILCWSTLENKNKFKADFQKIVYSLKD